MQKLTPYQKIDIVLKVFKDDPAHGFAWPLLLEKLGSNESPVNSIEMEPILGKLVKDGYIRNLSEYPDLSVYVITFEGLIFDGYEKQRAQLQQSENTHTNREKRLIYATWFAGIAALAVIAWDMIKFFFLEGHYK